MGHDSKVLGVSYRVGEGINVDCLCLLRACCRHYWGLWGEDEQKSMGGSPRDGVSRRVRVADPFCHGLPPSHRPELCTGQQQKKICEDFSYSENMVFNENFCWTQCGPDTMIKWRKEVIPEKSRSCRFRPPITGFCQWIGESQHQPRTLETANGPLGAEDIPWRKIHLPADLALSHLAVLGTILDSGGLAAIFARLEFSRFLYLEVLQVRVLSYANLAILHP